MSSWFQEEKPNEVYIGCNVVAVFEGPSVWLRNKDGGGLRIDHGSVTILSGALAEWQKKQDTRNA